MFINLDKINYFTKMQGDEIYFNIFLKQNEFV